MYLAEIKDLEIARARANNPANKLIITKKLRIHLGQKRPYHTIY
jgi:hypothetical protein